MKTDTSNNQPFGGQALTIRKVCQRTGASRTTVYRWMRLPPDRRLAHVRVEGYVRIFESQLQDFLGRHGV